MALHTLFSICVLLVALQRLSLLEPLKQWLFSPDVDPQRDGADAPLGSGAMFDRIAPVYDLANKYMRYAAPAPPSSTFDSLPLVSASTRAGARS